jgi:hypothetical protein
MDWQQPPFSVKKLPDISPSVAGNQIQSFVGVHAKAVQTWSLFTCQKSLNLNLP